VTVDGSGRAKPDLAAPGHLVPSAVPGGGCSTLSGTSMAGPHVAGLVALLISAKPELAGEVDAIEQILRDSAVQPVFDGECGVAAGVFPNHTFGAGRIDALAAVQLALVSLPFVADFEENDLAEWSAAQP
jgi:subtilisin family serine protease